MSWTNRVNLEVSRGGKIFFSGLALGPPVSAHEAISVVLELRLSRTGEAQVAPG